MTDATLDAYDTHRAWPSLVENNPLRFVAVMILYFMQGVPVGLSLIALCLFASSRINERGAPA